MDSFLIILYMVIEIALAVLFCFFGYRFIRKIVAAYGFIFGSMIAYILLAPIAGLDTILAIILSLVIGVIVGMLAYFLYHVGIFLSGANFGFIVATFILLLFNLQPEGFLPIAILVAFAVCGGVLTIIYRRLFIIISTSVSGASTIASYICALIFSPDSILAKGAEGLDRFQRLLENGSYQFYQSYGTWMLLFIIIFSVAGIIVQFKKTAPKGKSGPR